MEGIGKAIIGAVIAVGAIAYAANNGGPSANVPGLDSNGNGSGVGTVVDPRCTNGNFRGGQGMDPQTLSDMQKMIQDACSRWQAQMDQRDRNGNTGPVPTIEIKPPNNNLEGS